MGAAGLAVDADFGGEDAADVRVGRGGGGEGEFAAGANLEVEGLEGVAGLPALGDEKPGFEAGGPLRVVPQEEAVGAGFGRVDGSQIRNQSCPPEVDALVGGVVQQVPQYALLAVDEVAVFQRAPRVPGNELAMSGADEVGLYQVHHVRAEPVHP